MTSPGAFVPLCASDAIGTPIDPAQLGRAQLVAVPALSLPLEEVWAAADATFPTPAAAAAATPTPAPVMAAEECSSMEAREQVERDTEEIQVRGRCRRGRGIGRVWVGSVGKGRVDGA